MVTEHVLCITSTVIRDLASLVISSPFYQELKRLKNRPVSHSKNKVRWDSVTVQTPGKVNVQLLSSVVSNSLSPHSSYLARFLYPLRLLVRTIGL